MEFGEVHCGGCERVLGSFPIDNKPQDEKLELYCDECKCNLESDKD